MTLVWQYGSNMDQARLNSRKRLAGSAKFAGLALRRGFTLTFPRSNRAGVGTASIVQAGGDDAVFGVLYEIPEEDMDRLDQIEGVRLGSYIRQDDFEVEALLGGRGINTQRRIPVVTYVAREEPGDHPTSPAYANHILRGISDHGLPRDYFVKVRGIVLRNNPDLDKELIPTDCPFCRFRKQFTSTHFDDGHDPACQAWIDFEYDKSGDLAWYAVLNGNQYTRGHSMVILGPHRKRITDPTLAAEEAAGLGIGVARVARRLQEVLGAPAVHILSLAEGIEHLHFHLIPREDYTPEDRAFYYCTLWGREVGGMDQGLDAALEVRRRFKAKAFQEDIPGMWYAGSKEASYRARKFWKLPVQERVATLEALAEQLRNPRLHFPFA